MARILVCEDDAALREVYHTILTAGGHVADVAENGRQGIKKCAAAHYDVILLDLMMPEVDGVGFLKLSKIKQKSPTTRVILLSNLSSGSEVERALQLGADEHVLKSSLTPRDLIALVEATVVQSPN